jgi:pyruvate dehydrogenase E1 component alpha subunit
MAPHGTADLDVERPPIEDGRLCPSSVEVAPYCVLTPDGLVIEGRHPALSAEEAGRAFEAMLLSRVFDDRATAMNRQGRFGGFAPALGQEACLVGSALALNPGRDWIVPQYRELPALVLHGYPLERLAAFSLGKSGAARVPDDVRVLPLQFSLAAQLPHAVGLAWGRRLRGHREVVLAYCGEGATSEGDFHEACNLAGVLRAPVVFVVQNNGWAISTPVAAQSATSSFAARALGYGFEGILVDGNDVLAMYEVTRLAVEAALAGEGPVLIEARTYRLGVHNMSDDPRRYQAAADLTRARELEPLIRTRRYLRSLGLLAEAEEAALLRRTVERVDAAISDAKAMPLPRPAELFDHVFAEPTAALVRQRLAESGPSGCHCP